jgi:hypothetical protein
MADKDANVWILCGNAEPSGGGGNVHLEFVDMLFEAISGGC